MVWVCLGNLTPGAVEVPQLHMTGSTPARQLRYRPYSKTSWANAARCHHCSAFILSSSDGPWFDVEGCESPLHHPEFRSVLVLICLKCVVNALRALFRLDAEAFMGAGLERRTSIAAEDLP